MARHRRKGSILPGQADPFCPRVSLDRAGPNHSLYSSSWIRPSDHLQSFRLPFPTRGAYITNRRITEDSFMHTVKELLREKGSEVWTIAPRVTVYEALELMAGKNIGALVAVEDGNVVGMFTERDYARKVILKGRSSKTTTVSELMVTDVLYVSPDDTIENCMALMTDKRLRHLPVMDNGQLAGLISIGDIVRVIISDREFTLRRVDT